MLDVGTDKYGLNAYIYDSTNDRTTDYDQVLFSPTKDGADAVGDAAQGRVGRRQGQDRQGGALDGKTAGLLVKVEALDQGPVAGPPVPHVGRAARIATWPTWPGEPGFTGDFDEYLAQKFPSSTAADFAVLEAGVVSEETYVEQGLYWETGHQPCSST